MNHVMFRHVMFSGIFETSQDLIIEKVNNFKNDLFFLTHKNHAIIIYVEKTFLRIVNKFLFPPIVFVH